MARRKHKTTISLQQLQVFAGATVAITAVLAMFAGGEEASLAAQVKAREAKNELVAAEREKLGTKKLASSLKVRTDAGGFGDDSGGGGDSGGGWGSGGGGGRRAVAAPAMPAPSKGQPSFLPPPGLQSQPGGKITRKGTTRPANQGADRDGGFGSGGGDGGQDGAGPHPDTSRLDAAIEASRQRSGSGSANGD